jgi:hypothetical protein
VYYVLINVLSNQISHLTPAVQPSTRGKSYHSTLAA